LSHDAAGIAARWLQHRADVFDLNFGESSIPMVFLSRLLLAHQRICCLSLQVYLLHHSFGVLSAVRSIWFDIVVVGGLFVVVQLGADYGIYLHVGGASA
jgi:hypothetical protein